jgi:hypothetical protein
LENAVAPESIFPLKKKQVAHIPLLREIYELKGTVLSGGGGPESMSAAGAGAPADADANTVPLFGVDVPIFQLVLQYVDVVSKNPFRSMRVPMLGTGVNMRLSGVPDAVVRFMWECVGLRQVLALHHAAQYLRMTMLAEVCVAFVATCVSCSLPTTETFNTVMPVDEKPTYWMLFPPEATDNGFRADLLRLRGRRSMGEVDPVTGKSETVPYTIKDVFPYEEWPAADAAPVEVPDVEIPKNRAAMITAGFYVPPSLAVAREMEAQLNLYCNSTAFRDALFWPVANTMAHTCPIPLKDFVCDKTFVLTGASAPHAYNHAGALAAQKAEWRRRAAEARAAKAAAGGAGAGAVSATAAV